MHCAVTPDTAHRWKPIAFALAGTALVGAALAQPASRGAGDEDDIDRPRASVVVRPTLRGDVEITVTEFAIAPGKLAAIARSALGCDWRPSRDGGTCRRLLQSDGTRVEGKLELAPLVQALRREGAEFVGVMLRAGGEPAAAPGTAWKKQESKRRARTNRPETYWFGSYKNDDLPPAFTVRMGEAWHPIRLAGPLVFVLIGPALLAGCIQLRGRRNGTSSFGIVWLNWILLGSWLYWISAMSVNDIVGFAMQARLDSMVPILMIGVAVYALPPLIAMALCVLILTPGLEEDAEALPGRMVKRLLAREGAFIVPLGVFVVGSSLFDHDQTISLISLPAAYVLYRILSRLAVRSSRGDLRTLESGELYDSVAALAGAAGAKLKGVFLMGTRMAQEVNAYATSAGCIVLTRGLVERLSRREVNAVVAHEAGHLSGKHISYKLILFWSYIVVVGPGATALLNRSGLPPWVLALPILPLLYVVAVAQLSQRHEFSADARAVAITEDPEGMIAALSRLSRITRSPVDWGGIQGSILTHPSMKSRVLAIASRSGLAPDRALAVLDDPDVIAVRSHAHHAGAGLPRHYELPAGMNGLEPIYNPTALASHVFWCSWGMRVALVLLLAGLGVVSLALIGDQRRAVRFFGACIPLAAWMYLRLSNLWDRLFRKRLKRRIARRLQPPPDAIFVSLLPGDRVYPVGGSYDWDLGFLSLRPDSLTYHGERAGFTVPRAAITGIAVQKGPLAWDRVHAVVVQHSGGAFVLRLCDQGYSQRRARQLEKRLTRWQRGELGVDGGATKGQSPYPPPSLPVLRPVFPSRWSMALAFVMKAGMLFIGTLMVLAIAVPVNRATLMLSLVPFAAPVAYLVAVAPVLLRRRPRIPSAPA